MKDNRHETAAPQVEGNAVANERLEEFDIVELEDRFEFDCTCGCSNTNCGPNACKPQ